MKEILPYAVPILQIVLTISVPIVVRILWKISESIQALNNHVAILIDRDIYKGKVLDDHEGRLRCLEKN